MRRWLRRLLRRAPKRQELCEVCGEWFADGWVVSATFDDDLLDEAGGGGSAMSAYYCRRHRPSLTGAIRWPR